MIDLARTLMRPTARHKATARGGCFFCEPLLKRLDLRARPCPRHKLSHILGEGRQGTVPPLFSLPETRRFDRGVR